MVLCTLRLSTVVSICADGFVFEAVGTGGQTAAVNLIILKFFNPVNPDSDNNDGRCRPAVLPQPSPT